MNETGCNIYQLLEDWQTLIAALIALAAAVITICVMRRQVTSDDQRHQNQLRRREMAARAQMPDALSGINQYLREVGKYLTEQSESLPTAPADSIATLKHIIEHIDDDAAQRTFELVSLYQVHRSRTLSGTTPPGEVEGLYTTVLLMAYANSLYGYARNEDQIVSIVKPFREAMSNALTNAFTLDFYLKNRKMFEELEEFVEKRHVAE